MTITRNPALGIILLLLLLSSSAFAQNFEGKIVYKNSFKSNMPNVSDAQFTSMMGSEQTYLFKKGNYKSLMNGSMMQWQLYRKADKKLYTKMTTSPTVYWNDASVNLEEIQKAEVNKGVITILGYTCDELILTCKSGVQKYYYNSKLKVNPKLVADHKFGNWAEVTSRIKSLPLKTVIENPQFILESTAIEVERMKVDPKEFELPEGVRLEKSPY